MMAIYMHQLPREYGFAFSYAGIYPTKEILTAAFIRDDLPLEEMLPMIPAIVEEYEKAQALERKYPRTKGEK